MRRAWRLMPVLIAIATACSPISSTPTATERRCEGETVEIGGSLPTDCLIKGFDGDALSLGEALAGKPAVLNFWASWCVYCIEEMPAFQQVFEETRGRVSFLGIDLLGVQAESEQAARSLADQTGVTYPLAFDEHGIFYERICPCQTRPIMPATVFAEADGTVAHLMFGPLDAAELRSLIREHLHLEV